MTETLKITRDGWLNTSSSDPEEKTIIRLIVSVSDHVITRNVSKRGGGDSNAINTSLLPVTQFISDNWWALLHEPVRPKITDQFRARHRLDTGTRSYSFPALALWSGGDSTILADWAIFENPHSTISFITPDPREPAQLIRDQVEDTLMDLVEATLERSAGSSEELRSSWDRVTQSIGNSEERNYCIAAGRLGLDPYDPDTPDLTVWTEGINESLFTDVAEVADVENLPETLNWIRENETRLKLFPETDISFFGAPEKDDLRLPAWVSGVETAKRIQATLGLDLGNPRRVVDELLGSLVAESGELSAEGPTGVTAMVQRLASAARIGTIAKSARQRRFRGCAAIYLGWTATDGEERATTEAATRRQQSSRAFAAEMVAPRDVLLDRATADGFDDEDLWNLAGEFICPYDTVMWQAVRANIPLRGINLPRFYRAQVLTSA